MGWPTLLPKMSVQRPHSQAVLRPAQDGFFVNLFWVSTQTPMDWNPECKIYPGYLSHAQLRLQGFSALISMFPDPSFTAHQAGAGRGLSSPRPSS